MYHVSSDTEEYDVHEQQLGPNPALSLSGHSRAQGLRSTLMEVLPYCCGTIDVSPRNCVIFYGHSEQARRVDVPVASDEALNALRNACNSPKTVPGAGELNNDHFAVNVDLESLGLLDAVRASLFAGKYEKTPIRAELSKLVVHGQDALSRPLQDNSSNPTVLGTLVLVFPTTHEGGRSVFRQGNREWVFDAAPFVSTAPASPRVAYAAFLRDVEYGVAKVTSGHRISIHYHLFHIEDSHASSATAKTPSGLTMIQPKGANAPSVTAPLRALLDDPTFLPQGGTLGFGLRHLYTLPTSFRSDSDTTLQDLQGRLTGVDLALLQACDSIGLRRGTALHALFEDEHDYNLGQGTGAEAGVVKTPRVLVAFPRIAKLDTHESESDKEQAFWTKLCRHFQGSLINAPPQVLERAQGAGVRNRVVQWITPVSDVNRVKTRFAAYLGEPMMGYLYQKICLLVDVGPPGRR